MRNADRTSIRSDRIITRTPSHRLFVKAFCKATTRVTGSMRVMATVATMVITVASMPEAYLVESSAGPKRVDSHVDATLIVAFAWNA